MQSSEAGWSWHSVYEGDELGFTCQVAMEIWHRMKWGLEEDSAG